jgi:peptidoglycan hydrolase-like protein with peptidoglycan-binding domain
MGRFVTSLLVIVFQIYFVQDILADEQVRKVQEELRKRHLFHNNITGETSPALTSALKRYQEIKGFPRTGVIDFSTSASLGIAGKAVPTTTPAVLDNNGNVRGANGEALPNSLPSFWASEERAMQIDPAIVDRNPVPAVSAKSDAENIPRSEITVKRKTRGRLQRIPARKETNPFLQAFSTMDHAMKSLFADPDSKKKRRSGKHL